MYNFLKIESLFALKHVLVDTILCPCKYMSSNIYHQSIIYTEGGKKRKKSKWEAMIFSLKLDMKRGDSMECKENSSKL